LGTFCPFSKCLFLTWKTFPMKAYSTIITVDFNNFDALGWGRRARTARPEPPGRNCRAGCLHQLHE
jgi:hypothetical protein